MRGKGLDSLAVRCPVCRAEIGRKCTDYRGYAMSPHRSRRDLVTAAAYRGRARAARVDELADRNGKQLTLWDSVPAEDLS